MTVFALAVLTFLAIVALFVSLVVLGQARLHSVQIRNIENAFVHNVARLSETDRVTGQRLTDVERLAKRTLMELVTVRDGVHAKIEEQARSLQSQGTGSSGNQKALPPNPAHVVPFAARGNTLAAAVRTVETAGVRADDHREGSTLPADGR